MVIAKSVMTRERYAQLNGVQARVVKEPLRLKDLEKKSEGTSLGLMVGPAGLEPATKGL